MSYVFGDSFDLYQTLADAGAGYWDSLINGGGSINQSGRFGGNYYRSAYNTGLLKNSHVNDPVHHITVALLGTSTTTDTYPGFCFTFMDGTSAQCTVYTGRNGALYLCSGAYGGTVLDSLLNVFPTNNQWAVVEVEVVIHNTAGSWTIRKNGNTGTPDRTLGSLNTRGGTSNNYANALQVGVNNPTGNDTGQILDDLLWRSGDASGIAPAGVPWVGDIRCYSRSAASDGTVQFSRTTANPLGQSPIYPSGVGYNNWGSTVSFYKQFACAYPGQVSGFTVSTSNSGYNVKGAIYNDNNGVPGTTLATVASQAVSATGNITLTLPSPITVTTGQKIWVAFMADSGGASLLRTNSNDAFSGQISGGAYASFPAANPGPTIPAPTLSQTLNYVLPLGSNAACVGEIPQDGLTTYVYDSTVGHADFYNIAARNSPAPPATTVAVITRAFMQKGDAGSRVAAVQVKSSGTTVQGPSTPPNAGSFSWVYRADLTDPHTSATWVPSAVDAMQIGPIVVS